MPAGVVLVAAVSVACSPAAPTPPPIGEPGTPARPREVTIVAREYTFSPSVVRLVPGETVLLHVVNGGLELHEAVLGDAVVQTTWEHAWRAAVASPLPPGRTPAPSVPPDTGGLRIVVASGQRADALYTVPAGGDLVVGCHVPGHWERGMRVPVELVRPVGAGG
ncbi:MAG TPA: hypothetical protein VNJ28_04695 [Candidatus Limnocylindrales bacterium]|nr:hypothetical protein [Candidatus Limnocylindrales bacterium]